MRPLALTLFLFVGLSLVACSDDDTSAPDAGTSPADVGKTPTDTAPKKPDGPKKPASWVQIPGAAPVVFAHSATALQDGRVLVAGGYYREGSKADEAMADTFLFNPKANTFKPAGKLKVARAHHRAVLLKDGRVLVFGGRQSTYKVLDSAELFDPKKGTWSPGGTMSTPRTSHTVVLLQDGNVLTVGGVDTKVWAPLKSLEVFKPGANAWTVLGLALGKGHALASATLLNSGKVLIAGGYDGTAWLDTVITFDAVAGGLAVQQTKLSERRCDHTATRTADGRVLIVGGTCGTGCTLKGNELYNPTTGKVTSASHSGPTPHLHAATRLADGRVLITGGITDKVMSKVVVYSAVGAGSWTSLPAMKYARAGHTATLLPDGSVLVVGGHTKVMVKQAERLHNP